MPFEKVDTQAVDFPALERRTLQFWDDRHIFAKLREKIAGKPRWSFLDGPITANNPMGVHHAWGRTYKDAYNRYFAMTGHDLRFQNGFDCQGLWVEVEVEKELGLKSKRDIENLVPGDREASIAKFVQACKDRVDKFARVQTDQSIRLGYWMDWDRTDADWAKTPDERKSYFTMSERNNFAIWAFLKKCHGKGLVYRGYDVMPWCGRCGVGLSEMEMKEGYKTIEHRACFVKLPLKDKPGENLLVWTTTPWTLTSNVGAAVNPELTYQRVKLKGEVYYVAKGAFKLNRMESAGGDDDQPEAQAKGKKRDWLDGVPHLSSIEQIFKSKAGKEGFTLDGEVKGAELLGLAYAGPFDDLPAQQHAYGFPADVAAVTKQQGWCLPRSAAESHRVVDGGKDVSDTEGTGIVHSAPGCGQIDYTWGKASGLPPVAPIGDDGRFLDGFGPLTGMSAADPATADAVFDELKKKDRLFAVERYVHRYPHCWRCKTELLYRLVDEWFIDMGPKGEYEDGWGWHFPNEEKKGSFRGDIAKIVQQVTFLPKSINGQARELDWLGNMGDWMISKKRYWGLALPIWVDDQDPTQFEVIGSRDELKARAVEGWAEFDGHTPHRPYIDQVKIRNPRTGNLMSRVPDVGNPWLDAGIVAYSTQPPEWRPADFITESFPGQFRNWFYALLAMSTMMSDGEQPPFKTLLGHGLVRDQYGHEMHKSTGNSIEFTSAADRGGEIKDPKGKAVPFNAIGADVMRWLYCRHNPAANLSFGPAPADEVRAKFVLKLWNCYAFFANYARLDGFDPTAEPVPVKDRPKNDCWILADLQEVTRTARASFERYDVMSFCLDAERFVDDRLSNWYVRRNRDRFWSKSAELDDAGKQDKLAAYQTLYTVLRDMCRLIAPVVPFLAETMWQNLRTDRDPESVHLCDYPASDENLDDPDLLLAMTCLLNLVNQAMGLRNQSRQKVRQPLASLTVRPSNPEERAALVMFADQLIQEINVKSLRIHDPKQGELLQWVKKPNPKLIRQRLADLGLVNRYQEVWEKITTGQYRDVGASGMPSDVQVTLSNPHSECIFLSSAIYQWAVPEGQVASVQRATQMLLDARITPELKAEGQARDVVRLVQDARKDAGLDVADKIELFVGAAGELAAAVAAHRATIAAETQAVAWADAPPAGGYSAEKTLDGQPVTIGLRKV
jgi:isoleucyl-tRNA synthetase